MTRDALRFSDCSGSAPSWSDRNPAWVCWVGSALVVTATAIAFLPVLENDFVTWDDVASLLTNPHYRGLGWENLRWMFTATLTGHYVPLTWLSFAVNFMLGGMNPWGYHLGNLLLHAVNAGVFYFVARRLLAVGLAIPPGNSNLQGRWNLREPAISLGAVFAALAFGVHPLRVESVAWATERRDVLCGLFYLLATLAYLRGVEGGGKIQGRWWALSVGIFLLALLSKAAAMPLPAALLLLDIYPLRRVGVLGWRRLLFEKMPYFVLAALIAPVALIAQSSAGALAGFERYGIGSRLVMVAYSFMYYPCRFVWWANLSPMYEVPGRIDPLAPRFLHATIGVGIVTVGLVALRRRWPAGLTAWAYSALLVLPVSGVAHAGVQLVADRYSYLSGLGLALLAGAALVRILEARGMLRGSIVAACLVAAVLVIVVLATGTWRQTKVWHDTETLFRYAVSVDSRNALAHYYLGNWLSAARPHEAVAEYQLAGALTDRADFRAVCLERAAAVLNYQAIVRAEHGELLSARRLFGQALRVVPGFPDACGNLTKLAKLTRVDPQEFETCPRIAPGEAQRSRSLPSGR